VLVSSIRDCLINCVNLKKFKLTTNGKGKI
jgi:hypothetical protein